MLVKKIFYISIDIREIEVDQLPEGGFTLSWKESYDPRHTP
jgi:hypothetical protein